MLPLGDILNTSLKSHCYADGQQIHVEFCTGESESNKIDGCLGSILPWTRSNFMMCSTDKSWNTIILTDQRANTTDIPSGMWYDIIPFGK